MICRTLTHLFAATLVVLGVVASPANAQMVGYLSADAIYWEFEDQSGSSADSAGGRIALGTHLNSRFGAEMQAAGLGSDQLRGEKAKLENSIGVYAKAIHPVTRHFRAFALAGAAQVEFSHGSGSTKDSGFSWGLGLEFDADTGGKWAIRLDHMHYLDTPATNLQATGLGVMYRF